MRYLLFLAILVFLLSLLTGVTTVEPGERAVVRRFGRVLEEKPFPGLYVGLPWGIDRVDRVQVERVRSVKIGFDSDAEASEDTLAPSGQLLTGDQNVINIQAVVLYAVNPDEVDRFVFQQDQADMLVTRAAEALLAEWVGSRSFDSIFVQSRGPGAGRDGERSFRDLFVEEMAKRLEDYKLGVVIQDARITYLNPPREVKAAFDNVTRAEKGIEEQINRAQAERNAQLLEAGAEAQRIIQLARKAYEKELVLPAQAAAKNFEDQLASYHQLSKTNPYYMNFLWWVSMNRLYEQMGNERRIRLLDQQLGPNLDLMHSPLWPGRK
jgi:membrane protease subunit HflK